MYQVSRKSESGWLNCRVDLSENYPNVNFIFLCVGNQFLAVTIHFGTFICIWRKNIRLVCLQMAAGIWENSKIFEKWFNYFRHLYCSDRSEKLIPYSELSQLYCGNQFFAIGQVEMGEIMRWTAYCLDPKIKRFDAMLLIET